MAEEEKKRPVLVDEKPLLDLAREKCEGCADPLSALQELRKRILEAGLKPIPHKAPCLANNKESYGLFGSLLKGTWDRYSDIDFAVVMPEDYYQKLDVYTKLLDRTFYRVKVPYGEIVYGDIARTDVSLYFVKRDKNLHSFYVDGILACELNDSDKEYVKQLKSKLRSVGVYGEYGGVPGVAIETAVLQNRKTGVPLHDILLWDYLPLPTLEGYVAGNAFGRTFYINQLIAHYEVFGIGKTSYEEYLSEISKRRGYTVEYVKIREYLPSSLVYTAYVRSLFEIIGIERGRYLGKLVGVFGAYTNGYIFGLALPRVYRGKPARNEAVAPDRIILLGSDICAAGLEVDGINFEDGLICAPHRMRTVDLAPIVVQLYRLYKTELARLFDTLLLFRTF